MFIWWLMSRYSSIITLPLNQYDRRLNFGYLFVWWLSCFLLRFCLFVCLFFSLFWLHQIETGIDIERALPNYYPVIGLFVFITLLSHRNKYTVTTLEKSICITQTHAHTHARMHANKLTHSNAEIERRSREKASTTQFLPCDMFKDGYNFACQRDKFIVNI